MADMAACNPREEELLQRVMDNSKNEDQNIRRDKELTSTSKDLLEIGPVKGDNSLLITRAGKSKTAGPPKIFKQPPSSVLQQVRNFLPQLAAAQEDLDKRRKAEPEENFDIENVEECDNIIEMTLALVEQSSDSDSEEEDSSTDDVCTTDLQETGLMGPVTEESLRLPRPRKSPKIEVISSENRNASVDIMDCTDTTASKCTLP